MVLVTVLFSCGDLNWDFGKIFLAESSLQSL